MGIRMLRHRTAAPRAGAEEPVRVPLPPVPVLAPGASTARIPETLTTVLRRAAAGPRRGLAHRAPAAPGTGEAPAWRLWAELARGYPALALTLLRRPRPAPALTVSAATAGPFSARANGPAPYRHRPTRPGPGPGAAP
ncbi:hypothetical protein SUDANB58_01327 [Streptomyces sp. enrichment culture]|uniref:hypothetical protein n=1 Tax=Streptomyces sp. enrichment culture TaxID=1795815 RepID=UPI003F546B75